MNRGEADSAFRTPVPWGLLVWLYLVVLWLTWTPTRDVPPEILWLPSRLSGIIILGNLLLFAPLGAVLAASRIRARSPGSGELGRTVVFVVLTVALLSMVVELGQLRVAGRHVSPYDVVLNSAGAAGAAWLALRLIRAAISPRHVMVGTGLVVFLGVVVFLSATGFAASRMTVLFQWHPEYSVVMGDEDGGGREYRGVVSGASICGGPPEEELCARPGAGSEERSALAAGARDAQRVRLSAGVTSWSPQTTDARIVTFSADVYHRNATLYQRDRDLILRLRTPRAGPNGTELEFGLRGAVREDEATRVSASYERGRVMMLADGAEESVRGRFPLGYLAGWWLVKEPRETLVEPRALLRAVVVAAAAIALPFGLLAAGWGGVPLALRLAAGGLLPLLFLSPVAGALRIPLLMEDLAASAAFGLLGVALGLSSSSGPGRWTRASDS